MAAEGLRLSLVLLPVLSLLELLSMLSLVGLPVLSLQEQLSGLPLLGGVLASWVLELLVLLLLLFFFASGLLVGSFLVGECCSCF